MAAVHGAADLPVGYPGSCRMRQLTWPQAFALVFGALPAFVFTVAVLGVYPLVGWPILAGAVTAYGLHRRVRRREALALRAEATHAANLTLVAAPLPEMPTVPIRALGNSVASMRRAG